MKREEIQQIIREEIGAYFKSDRFILDMTLQLQDGRNIQTGKTTGTMIGTEATQKVGFHGKKSAQATAISDPTGGVTVDGPARGVISSILTVLRDKGFIAT